MIKKCTTKHDCGCGPRMSLPKKTLIPGYRFFECSEGHEWEDRSRDYRSPSADHCPECGDIGEYRGGEPHPEWETDQFGNLK
jgi:hypothetical protein